MQDMDRAVERVARAIQQGEKIAIYGDYDVDGLTATALLLRLFRLLKVDAEWHIPHRLLEGYGMNPTALESLHKRGVKLIITVDNGISSIEEIAYASQLGMDVVVTDHHLPGARLPDAAAVVNPNRADCSYPCPFLAGVGVAFKFAYALLLHLKIPTDDYKAFLREHLDLVGLGTISDMVPLTDENRILAHYGLLEARRSSKAGLRAMRQMLCLEGDSLTPRAVGFIIGPRLNAAGRTGYADMALELLITEDHQRASKIVEALGHLNDERRRIETEILEEAIERIEQDETFSTDPVLVVDGPNWHHGVIGIVASRLLAQFNKPVVVLGVEDNHAKGSARSICGFDMVQALTDCSGHLLGFGGHALAAGLTMRADQINDFRAAINQLAQKTFAETPIEDVIAIDIRAEMSELTCECCEALSLLEPHGTDNPKPTVALHGVLLSETPRMVGRNSEHLRLTLTSSGATLAAIGFHLMQGNEWLLRHKGPVDVAGTPCINDYNGRRQAQLEILSIRPSQVCD